ncbi:ATP-binding protein [Paracoccus tegillarcae]|nr:ATP-binding protein [Paracoccus tegillarcae]
MSRLTLTQHILVVILAIQLVLLTTLAAASLRDLSVQAAAEQRTGISTARSLVLATIGTLQGNVPTDRLMAALPERLISPANASIAVLDARDDTVRQPAAPATSPPYAPMWFARLITPQPQETRLPVVIDQQMLGFVVIAADPAGQIAGAWRDIQRIVGMTALAALAQAALILWLTRRALRPVGNIAARLADLTRGRFDARVGPVTEPDLAPIGRGVDQLALTLEQARNDRKRLQRQVVTRADHERKAIARDLHDEMGPCLFGLRVEADALATATEDPKIPEHAAAITRIADQIGGLNRALLDDLRPGAIGQLPFADVLTGYVADLAARFPDHRILVNLPPGLGEPDEATAITLFRILQEGTTNALRHAGAERIEVSLSTRPGQWIMTVSDDGTGMVPDTPHGTGLSGMSERIALLSGRLAIQSDKGGTRLTAELPKDPLP